LMSSPPHRSTGSPESRLSGTLSLRVGFGAEQIPVSIGPDGIAVSGWLQDVRAHCVRDALFVKACVVFGASETIAIISIDVLSVGCRWVARIRDQLSRAFGFQREAIMIAATHNHAAPALLTLDPVTVAREFANEADRAVMTAVAAAVSSARNAVVGVTTGTCDIARNRRIVLADGSVSTHSSLVEDQDGHEEGPIDPSVGLVLFRSMNPDERLGCIVNYACHPIDFDPSTGISAGWPGQLRRELEDHDWPDVVFLNGAMGNVSPINPRATQQPSPEDVANELARAVRQASDSKHAYWETRDVSARTNTVRLSLRELGDAPPELAFGSQRFASDSVYERAIERLRRDVEIDATELVELQLLQIGNALLLGLPAEPFVEIGLSLRTMGRPKHLLPVGAANGMVGYLPTAPAFLRGGYETTVGPTSRLGDSAESQLMVGVRQMIT
jgi:neutral ceramidase